MTSMDLKILTAAHEQGKVFRARGITEKIEIVDILIFQSGNCKQQADKIVKQQFLKFMGYTLDASSSESTRKTIKLNSKSRVGIP